MKRKITIFIVLALLCGMILPLSAQDDTIRSLVISEVRLENQRNAYVEITNMGEDTLDLGQFSLTSVSRWQDWWNVSNPHEREWRYPKGKLLAPGESWTIGAVLDYMLKLSNMYPAMFTPYTKPELWEAVDEQVHLPELGLAGGFSAGTDSVSVAHQCLYSWSHVQGAYYLQWMSKDGTDSAAVDQVNLVLDGPFTDPNANPINEIRDVAGVSGATNNSVLVRKYSVREGNMDWFNAAGNDLAESEWMPVPFLHSTSADDDNAWDRGLFWTVGNHGAYDLDENTLNSLNPDVTVDFAGRTVSVPWGFRNNDSVMYQMERKPGVAWHYSFSPAKEDSAYNSVRLGDSLTVYVCGNDLDVARFAMIPRDPEPGTNIVVPKNTINWETIEYNAFRGKPFEVTDGLSLDTIYKVPFGTRMDTLLLYLEKPPAASWEFVTLNGEERADLKMGDILRVTAENGDVKDYFIKTFDYQASGNALLASIRWPDIDEFTYGAFGWKGDTIPNFSPGSGSYILNVPYYTEGIPHLVAKAQNVNTKIEVTRPKALVGSEEDRTMTFRCIAENDSTTFTYKVLFVKEKDPTDIQPWEADPFLSQYSHESWFEFWDNAWEFSNPGTEQVDMSHYLFAAAPAGTSPPDVITSYTDWSSRFMKYIPGMKFVDSTEWSVTPGLFTEDVTVNSIVYGGDVFVAASASPTANPARSIRVRTSADEPLHWNAGQFDVNFRDVVLHPWTDPASSTFTNVRTGTAINAGQSNHYLFRIDNDSVYSGLKPATDPQDFTLIDLFGYMDGTGRYSYMNRNPVTFEDEPAKQTHQAVHFRKPEVYKGKPEGFSDGSKITNDSSEWYAYFSQHHFQQPPFSEMFTWAESMRMLLGWLGTHTMDEVTFYMSFVISNTYLVDEGYQGDDLEINGVVTGTTADDFLSGIIRKNEGQVLTVKDAMGTVITGSTPVPDGATLEVVSADGTSMTWYTIVVTEGGLSDDAVLTSDVYEITVAGSAGFITGFPYGTTLKEVTENITRPFGSHWVILDDQDFFVPFQQLNFDTVQVDVQVTDQIYIEVTAEDKTTMIRYQLLPEVQEGELLVTSDVYEVDQDLSVISLIPEATNTSTLLYNLTPSAGATLSVHDKFGFDRIFGPIYRDDVVRVTALGGMTNRDYYLVLLGLEEFANYLAYVTSNVYIVNQTMMSISEVPGNIDVNTFTGNLTPAPQAMLEVMDDQGTGKAGSDMMAFGDQVKVTAANGVTVAYYTVETITGIDQGSGVELSVYPNPTGGNFYLQGVNPGDRIRVYNAVGESVLNRVATGTPENLSLEGAPAGMYFITVERTVDSEVSKIKLIKSN